MFLFGVVVMENGLYKAAFATQLGAGAGVIVLQDGKLRGGDSVIAYVGSYHSDGKNLQAEVSTSRHTEDPEMRSVLGMDSATLKLSGPCTATTAELADSTGRFKARLNLLSR
ncbi:hypothetical protein [Pyruvatibacter mobilis]|uniref:hypothetical protein n=1 Tax=Pyruvatibacter mobilis TaxID=1712261 RepID=UPI003BAC2324